MATELREESGAQDGGVRGAVRQGPRSLKYELSRLVALVTVYGETMVLEACADCLKAGMVNHLQHAQKSYSLEQELNRYRKPQVLIIDELGYVALDTQASNLFFQVISSRHDAGLGTIATTNISFGKFNQIFASDAIAHAIVDQLVNEAEVFYFDWDSYRSHQRQEKLKRKRQAA